jgi:large subunit ribosomal protein L23
MPLFKKSTKSKTPVKDSQLILANINPIPLVKGLRITEKATALQTQDQYIFEIDKRATKSEIKKAVEKEYKVTVTRVNTINSPDKPKHYGRHVRKTGGVAKAVVTIKKGQKIETGI